MLGLFLLAVEDEFKSKFELIYYKHRKAMASVAKALTKSDEEAEDVLSLAFLSIAENIKIIRIDNERRLRGYVITVVRNICINRFNKRNGENLSSESDVSGALPYIDFEIELESKEICEIIINKILMMPESYKCALYLHYAHGHTAKEIAKITGENENTVKSRLRRGTLLLKKILSDEGIAE